MIYQWGLGRSARKEVNTKSKTAKKARKGKKILSTWANMDLKYPSGLWSHLENWTLQRMIQAVESNNFFSVLFNLRSADCWGLLQTRSNVQHEQKFQGVQDFLLSSGMQTAFSSWECSYHVVQWGGLQDRKLCITALINKTPKWNRGTGASLSQNLPPSAFYLLNNIFHSSRKFCFVLFVWGVLLWMVWVLFCHFGLGFLVVLVGGFGSLVFFRGDKY